MLWASGITIPEGARSAAARMSPSSRGMFDARRASVSMEAKPAFASSDWSAPRLAPMYLIKLDFDHWLPKRPCTAR